MREAPRLYVKDLTDLVDCNIAPRGTERPVLDTGWADRRAAELRAQGVEAEVLRLRGETPCVCYRLPA